MGINPNPNYRPKITLQDGQICHSGGPCRVVLSREKISVACTDITPEALRHVLAEWNKIYGIPDSVELQP